MDLLEEDARLDLAFLNLCRLYGKWKEQKRTRRWSVNPRNRDRLSAGYFQNVFLQLKKDNEKEFFRQTSMTSAVYDLFLNLVYSYLERPFQRISSEERLAITLSYLAHGESFRSIACRYKMGKTTVRNIVLEVCETLWNVLSGKYLSKPNSEQYQYIANDFSRLWNIPNCVGALDGKHIAISCPKEEPAMYLNYKQFYSIVLMGTCDAQYKFTSASVGSYGKKCDGGIFENSRFGRELMSDELPLPPCAPLSNDSMDYYPYFFAANSAFPLKSNLMRPYAASKQTGRNKIFNYRLSRASRLIENSFGILIARWGVLRSVIECSPANCEKIVLACLVLHNFCMYHDTKRWYCPEKFVDWEDADYKVHNGAWRKIVADESGPLHSITSFQRNATGFAFRFRDTLAEHFLNEGAVPFQYIHSKYDS